MGPFVLKTFRLFFHVTHFYRIHTTLTLPLFEEKASDSLSLEGEGRGEGEMPLVPMLHSKKHKPIPRLRSDLPITGNKKAKRTIRFAFIL
jgi:hypothetical protein